MFDAERDRGRSETESLCLLATAQPKGDAGQ
jgi:hypothetical protein